MVGIMEERRTIKMDIKLTKKEKDFLLDWLCDDLDIELEKRRDQDEQSTIARKFLPKIIKKLEGKIKEKE